MRSILIILAILLCSENLFSQQVLINEVMTKNVNALYDPDGNTPDWIEIYNNSTNSLSLEGHSITDDFAQPQKWMFPDVSIDADSFMVLFASGLDRKTRVNHWETIIDLNQAWRYKTGSPEIPINWYEPDYNAAQWPQGIPGFGFGDGDDKTILLNTSSVFLIKSFNIDSLKDITAAVFHLDYDDGFVAYLNGVEIARNNLGTPGTPVSYNQFASGDHEAAIYSGGSPESFVILNANELLTTGKNILAVQVHNINASSSDLSAIPFLSIGYSKAASTASVPPEYLIFPVTRLHTNFSLSSSGENLFLFGPGNNLVDSVNIPSLSNDISYGRNIQNNSDFSFFLIPTPGLKNSNEGFLEKLETPVFSHVSGHYNSPFMLLLNATQGEDVYYTLDGSVPGKQSQKYIDGIILNKTHVVRAISYKDLHLPSEIVSGTYFINENISLPVISLITDPKNLWDYNEGIYVLGPNAEQNNPNFGANFWQDWEKECFLQFFDQYESLCYETNAGVKIFGSYSRASNPKSLSLHARKKYGAGKFNYELFPEAPFDKYETFLLRNSGNDLYYTMFRDALLQSLIEPLNMDYQMYYPSVLFLNGDYWGIHNVREKINEDYLALHHNLPANEIDLLENEGYANEGSNLHYTEMIAFIGTNDLAVDENYSVVESKMDVDNYINYVTSQIFFDNTDWPGNNIKYWRHNSVAGKWRWILYDTDFGFGIYQSNAYQNNTLEFALENNGPNWPNPPWSTFLFRNLIRNNSFKTKFINRYSDLTNTIFKSANILTAIDSFQNSIANEMSRHIQKWNPFTHSGWLSNIEVMKNFAIRRNNYLKFHYMNEFNLRGTYQLTVNINVPNSGKVLVNSIAVHQSEWRGYYFKGNEIKVTAKSKPGYRFVRWEGVDSDSETLNIVGDENVNITAIFEPAAYISPVVINEINYNSTPDNDTEDWVELYNRTDKDVNLSLWQLKDSDVGSAYIIENNTVLAANSYLVIARDTAAFKQIINQSINLLGNIEFALSNSGDEINLFDNGGTLIDSVAYDDSFPWTDEADGTGRTLSLKHPMLDNTLAGSWSASQNELGTPGFVNDNLISSIEENINQPIEFILWQNYPNPFNPTTVIEYELPVVEKQHEVSLHIYDILGQEVAILVNKQQKPGKYKIEFDAASLSRRITSGVYYYTLSTGARKLTKKMILLR